ncbi:MAG: aldehyde dehydrogenase, partial [Pseudomonas sp.]
MSNPNKDVIDVLNDLIEYSKDGEKGFKTSA